MRWPADALSQHFEPLVEDDESSGVVATIDGRAPHSDLGETDVRMLVAMVPDTGRTWFLKAVGLPDQVALHREAFLEFARSLPPTPESMGQLSQAAASTPPAAPAAAGGADAGGGGDSGGGHAAGQTHWNAPPHWQPEAGASSMLKGAYLAPNAEGKLDPATSARITLMTLPGDGGGALPNINRWRAQLACPRSKPSTTSP